MPQRLSHVPEDITHIEIPCRTLGGIYPLNPTMALEPMILNVKGTLIAVCDHLQKN